MENLQPVLRPGAPVRRGANAPTRGRAWFGTQYSRDLEAWKEALVLLGAISFVGQLETCPTTGRIHIQYCFRFTNARTFSSLREHRNFHYLATTTSWSDAVAYCTKDETRLDAPDAGPIRHGLGLRAAATDA